ncbi:MAG: hypothetical protein ACLU48_02330 [Clostridiaceae bacterium]
MTQSPDKIKGALRRVSGNDRGRPAEEGDTANIDYSGTKRRRCV